MGAGILSLVFYNDQSVRRYFDKLNEAPDARARRPEKSGNFVP
jgi:hypothetical protein